MAKRKAISGDFNEFLKSIDETNTSITTRVDQAGARLPGNNTVILSAKSKVIQNLPKEMKTTFQREMLRESTKLEADIRRALISNIETAMWPWKSPPTGRKAYKLGLLSDQGSSRDIIDEGRLRHSNVVQFKYLQTGFNLEVRNTVPYSGIVHWGGYIRPYGNMKAEKVYVPGRPWIAITLNRPVQGNYSKPSSPTVIDIEARVYEIFVTALSTAVANASK